jgi:phosphoserine phosphatase
MVTGNVSRVNPQLVIFDLCDTLYDQNTTIGFIRQYRSLQQDDHISRALRVWLSRFSPFFYVGAMAHRLFGWDLARQRLIAALTGESKAKLIEAATDYARNVLPSRANPLLHDRLESHLTAGDRVILLSSSIDLVVAEVALALGVEYRASRLGFSGDRCTGRLTDDLTGRKTAAIRDLLDTGPTICVYTDNRSDSDLIAIADRATIIIPHGRRDDQWGGSGCEYIRL